jgi:predicted protein tyrosine phosphatase
MTLNRITFVSRSIAQGIRPGPAKALISIHDKADGPMKGRGEWDRRLTLEFSDESGASASGAQAKAVLDFAAEVVPHVEEIIVHCLYGQSRSAAVALFLAEKYGVPLYQYRTLLEERYKYYNRTVYQRLLEQESALPS